MLPVDLQTALENLTRNIQTVTTTVATRKELAADLADDKPAIGIRWYLVKWDWDGREFNPATMRAEPDTAETAAKLKQPYGFPWVYLPANHAGLTVHQILAKLNARLVGAVDRNIIQATVRKFGGECVSNGKPLSETPPIVNRHVTNPRVRNRTRASAKQHTTLREVIQREAHLYPAAAELPESNQHDRVSRPRQAPVIPITEPGRTAGTKEWTPLEMSTLEDIMRANGVQT